MKNYRTSLTIAVAMLSTIFAYVDWTPIPYHLRLIVVLLTIECFWIIADPELY